MATATSYCISVIFGTLFVTIGGCGLIWWLSLETPPMLFLLKTDNGTIESINFDDINRPNTLIAELTDKISAFNYYKDKTIYYGTNKGNQTIRSWMKGFLKYPDLPDFTTEWTKTALAVDEVSDKLYVLDGQAGKVYVMDLQGKHHAVLYTGLEGAIDVAVDPNAGLIFVLQKTAILQGEMDGSQKTLKKVIDKPNLTAFALHPENSEVIFAAGGIIWSYRRDKNEQMEIAKFGETVISMTVAEKENASPHWQRLYLIKVEDSKKRAVMSCALESDSRCEVSRGHYNRPDLAEIKAYRRYRELPASKCKDNAGCAHLCLLSSSIQGYSCVCDEGSKLNGDQKTCTPVKH